MAAALQRSMRRAMRRAEGGGQPGLAGLEPGPPEARLRSR